MKAAIRIVIAVLFAAVSLLAHAGVQEVEKMRHALLVAVKSGDLCWEVDGKQLSAVESIEVYEALEEGRVRQLADKYGFKADNPESVRDYCRAIRFQRGLAEIETWEHNVDLRGHKAKPDQLPALIRDAEAVKIVPGDYGKGLDMRYDSIRQALNEYFAEAGKADPERHDKNWTDAAKCLTAFLPFPTGTEPESLVPWLIGQTYPPAKVAASAAEALLCLDKEPDDTRLRQMASEYEQELRQLNAIRESLQVKRHSLEAAAVAARRSGQLTPESTRQTLRAYDTLAQHDKQLFALTMAMERVIQHTQQRVRTGDR